MYFSNINILGILPNYPWQTFHLIPREYMLKVHRHADLHIKLKHFYILKYSQNLLFYFSNLKANRISLLFLVYVQTHKLKAFICWKPKVFGTGKNNIPYIKSNKRAF